MNILAIDTSTSIATVALKVKDQIYTKDLNDTRTHSQKLLPLIMQILSENNLKISDLDLFICGNGPGSFTGIRIGASTIKALAQVTKKDIFGVSTLDALAYNVVENSKYICSLIDARNDNAYYCIYKADSKDNTVEYISKHEAENIDVIVEKLTDLKAPVTIVGSGVDAYKEKLEKENFVLANNNDVSAKNLMMMYNAFEESEKDFIKENTFTCHSFKPIYLRPSQAERLKK